MKKDKLPEKYKELKDADIKTKVAELYAEVKTAQEAIAPKADELSVLSKYLDENGLLCQHEQLVRETDKIYHCANKECNKTVVVKHFT